MAAAGPELPVPSGELLGHPIVPSRLSPLSRLLRCVISLSPRTQLCRRLANAPLIGSSSEDDSARDRQTHSAEGEPTPKKPLPSCHVWVAVREVKQKAVTGKKPDRTSCTCAFSLLYLHRSSWLFAAEPLLHLGESAASRVIEPR